MIWLLKADSLIAAFDVLIADDERMERENLPGRRVQSVAYMLAGFAIENLLKGILIAEKTPLNENGKFTLKSHELLELAADAGYELVETDQRLLERIQEFTVWTGRYPIPLNSESMRPRSTPDGGFAPRTFHQLSEDWPTIRVLFGRFRDDLSRVCQTKAGC
jgi:hypothetical protein